MSNPVASIRLHYGIALLLGFVIVTVYVAIVAPIAYLYSDPDTSYYLEAARNFLAGKGLVVSTGLDKSALGTEPLSLWPPGYPMMVAFGSKLLGVDPMWLAPKIVWLSWALLPTALLFTLRPALNSWHAHIVSALVMISPGAVGNAWQAMTDVPFLFLTVLAFGTLFRGTDSATRPSLLVLAGILFALAYSVRNVGLASFAAIFGAYTVLVLLKRLSPRAALLRMAWLAAGASLIVVPLLVRNITVFGTLQPYDMPPSQVGLIANIRYFAAAWLNDIFVVRGLLHVVLRNNAILVALGGGALILVYLTRTRLARVWSGLPPHTKEMFAVLVAYGLAGATVVIVARSRYEWGETIGFRHVLQYDWILFGACAVLLERWGKMPRGVPTVVLTAVIALVGLRVVYVGQDLAMRRADFAIASRSSDPVRLTEITDRYRYLLAVKFIIARDHQLMQAVQGLPSDTILVSNYEDVLRVGTGRLVHPILRRDDCDLPKQLAVFSHGRSSPANVAVLLFPKRDMVQSGCWERLQNSSLERFGLGVTRPYLISLSAGEIGANPQAASP